VVVTSPVNEASPRILEGLKNLITPDLDQVAMKLRVKAAASGGQLRQDAPNVVARASEWILEYSDEICDVIEAGVENVPMSRPMLAEAFRNCVSRWTDAERLRSLVREECGNQNVGRPILPEVIFHNLAGNLFISGWESITHAVLLGAGSIVRCSESDRVFPGVWASALEAVQPGLRGQVIVCEWDSQDSRRFKEAVRVSDSVVCYGSDEAVHALRQMTPWNKPFAGHGSTVSFALVTADELRHNPVEALAEGCAYDFAAYDQQGCLSPRALLLEDRIPRDVDRFVDALYAAAQQLEKRLPRGPLTLEDRASQARKRDEVLLDAACGGASRRVSTNADPFLMTVKPVERFELGPVNRYLDVYLFKDLNQVKEVLAPLAGRISTIAVPDPRRCAAELFDGLEVKRVCELGTMQIPPLAWCLDGLRPLQKFFRHQTVQLG